MSKLKLTPEEEEFYRKSKLYDPDREMTVIFIATIKCFCKYDEAFKNLKNR